MSNPPARTVASSSTDPRALRTRTAILTATAELFASVDGDFSVQQIADRAGISRASFYTHFSGVDTVLEVLLEAAFAGVRDEFETELRGGEDQAVTHANTRIVDTVWQHRAVFAGMLSGTMRADAHDVIARAIAQQVSVSLQRRLNPIPSGIDPAITAAYVGGAAATVLTAWITGRIDTTREQVIDNLTALLPPWLGAVARA